MPYTSLQILVTQAKIGQALVSFPTDTVPALACRPDRSNLIFTAKQRSLDKPLILMAASLDDLWPYISSSFQERQIWQRLTDRYWPGALTLVLPASDRVDRSMNPQTPGTIGVRVPQHPVAQAILRQTGPLATTSVNRSGQPPLLTADEIAAQFPEVLILAAEELDRLEGDQVASGLPSTVARWTSQGWDILRQGAVRLDGDNDLLSCP